MKKIISAVFTICLSFSLPALATTYTINDLDDDATPYNSETFESYGINVWAFTPGVNNGLIYFGLYTDLSDTKAGEVADLFIYEKHYGSEYLWAMPLTNHDTFIAGDLYAVENYQTAADFGSGLNQNIPVRIESLGNNYGHEHVTGYGIDWILNDGADYYNVGPADYFINTVINGYEEDPNGNFRLYWATTVYGTDIVTGNVIPETTPVPVPASVLLFGTGAISLLAGKRRRK
jgi:hypothetical protein